MEGRNSVWIPDELVLQVLSYLPVKSLARFRCVCRSWWSIISDPLFVEMHGSRSPTSLLISLPDRPGYHTPHCLFSINVDGQSSRLPGLTHWWSTQSVNGLLCVYDQYRHRETTTFNASLCNPSTGDCTPLPLSAFSDADAWLRFHSQVLYLGFDPCTNTYKILRTFSDWTANYLEILTLGTHAWRVIKGAPQFNWEDKGLCLDGTIYWVVTIDDARRFSGLTNCVTAFDVAKEKFRYIPVPPEAAAWDPSSSSSFQMGGLVAVAEFHHPFMIIWKLEDSTAGVWSPKKIELPEWLMFKYASDYLPKQNRRLFCVVSGEGREIILIPWMVFRKPFLVHCDVEEERFWEKPVSPPPPHQWDFDPSYIVSCRQVCEHQESLISLKQYYSIYNN